MNDDVYLAVGRALLDFARLEFMAHRVAWTGLDPLNQEIGRAQTALLQLGPVLSIIDRLAKDGAYGQFVPGGDERARAFTRSCRALARERGQLAHSFVDGGRLGHLRDAFAEPVPLLGVTKPADLDRLRALPDLFFDLRDQGVALWLEVESAAQPSMHDEETR